MAEPITRMYRDVLRICATVIRGWGRLEVAGRDALPASGPVVLIGNHDSYWDPVAIGVAAMPRRQIRALAKSTLWKGPLVPILNGMGQIPIERGKGDVRAFDRAIDELRAGACIGVFPEGTISRGSELRARSGAGRLALAVPEATIVAVATRGTVDIVRVPTRPSIHIEFFLPDDPHPRPGESATDLTARVMLEARARAPITIPGRRRTAGKYRRAAEKAAADQALASASSSTPTSGSASPSASR